VKLDQFADRVTEQGILSWTIGNVMVNPGIEENIPFPGKILSELSFMITARCQNLYVLTIGWYHKDGL
jgi:hypothetical protein